MQCKLSLLWIVSEVFCIEDILFCCLPFPVWCSYFYAFMEVLLSLNPIANSSSSTGIPSSSV